MPVPEPSRRSAPRPIFRAQHGPETLVFALLTAAASIMLAGYVLDLAGLRMHPGVLACVALLASAISVLRWSDVSPAGDESRDQSGVETWCFLAVVAVTGAYLIWLASPSLLPVTIGPDVVHHLQLIHVIQRTDRLAHDPALGPYLLEMMNYTPGSHILAATIARWLRVDALRVVQPITALFTALKLGMLYLLALRVAPGSRSGRTSRSGPAERSASNRSAPFAAVAAPMLAFVPSVYTLGSSFHFFFYAQVISEAFAVGMLLAAAAWERTGARRFLVAFAACGVGVFLAWPVWLGPGTAAMGFVILCAPIRWRARFLAGLTAFTPIAAVAAVHAVRHAEAGRILTSAGAVTAPAVQAFSVGFLVCAAVGAAVAVRARAARPVVLFLAVTIGQALVLAMASDSVYMPFKMMYLAVFPAAVLGALALMALANAVKWPAQWAGAAAIALPLVGAALLLPGRIPVVRAQSPINEPAYAAGLWARDHLDVSCIDYFSRHWLTGYWLHLDVFGNPRVSDRMREETFELRDTIGKWVAGGGLRYGIVEHPEDIPRELRGEITTLRTFGSAAIVQNLRGRCP